MMRANDVRLLRNSLKRCIRVMSHISEAHGSNPLKYVPVSAYKEALKEARDIIDQTKLSPTNQPTDATNPTDQPA